MSGRITAGLAAVAWIAFGWAIVPAAALAAGPAAPSATAPAASGAQPAAGPAIAAQSPAPPPAAPQPPSFTPQAATHALAQIQNQVQATSRDSDLADLSGRTAAIEAAANRIVAAHAGDLAALDARLRRVAPAARRPGALTARRQQAELLDQRAAIEVQVQPAQAVAAAASALYSQIAERRREGFSARVLEQSPSPLSPDFWNALASTAGADAGRFAWMTMRAWDVAAEAPEPQAALGLGGCLVLALALLFPLRRLLERVGRRRILGDAPRHGFVVTAGALWVALVDTGLPTLAAAVLRLGAKWTGLLSVQAETLADAAVGATAWAAAIVALGRVIATERETHRRLAPLSDESAARLRVALWVVALITGAGFLLTKVNFIIGASVAATIAANCVVSLAYAAVAAMILVGVSRRPAGADGAPAPDDVRTPIWTLTSLALSIAILVTVGAVFAGYTTLAALVAGQIFWLSVIVAFGYLLLRFVDDLCAVLFSPQGGAGRILSSLFSFRAASIRQAGLLVAAALQLMIIVAAFSLALIPFGQSGNLLLARLGQFGSAIHIGTATISPAAIATGVATFAVGMAAVHVVRGWVVRRYLPVTGWDAGLRNSVGTGVGYLGVVLVLLAALSAMGLGFSQIALVASALSVGIGFGLQQIVQNFVCGVILLIERPVKVGDRVNVDGVEGDIRRIRVRATEIQLLDRSLVVVPNSDLITKAVQNKTSGAVSGRIDMQFAIGRAGDAPKAMEIAAGAAKANPKVLQTPEPAVFIDSLPTGGAIVFTCYMHVADPREAYRVRSDLYVAILEAFHREQVQIFGAPAV